GSVGLLHLAVAGSGRQPEVESAGMSNDEKRPLLDVHDLAIHYRTGAGPVRAVDGVDFQIAPGEALGLVGESGCGKTTAAKAMLKLLPGNAVIPQGEIRYDGRDLVPLAGEDMRRIRWKEIAWIS